MIGHTNRLHLYIWEEHLLLLDINTLNTHWIFKSRGRWVWFLCISKIKCLYWFADFIILFRGFPSQQYIIYIIYCIYIYIITQCISSIVVYFQNKQKLLLHLFIYPLQVIDLTPLIHLFTTNIILLSPPPPHPKFKSCCLILSFSLNTELVFIKVLI